KGIKQGIFKRISSVYIGKVISFTLQQQCNLCSYGIVRGLDKSGGREKLLFVFNNSVQKFFRVFNATQSSSNNNCLRIDHFCLKQSFIGGIDTHFYAFCHTAAHCRSNQFFIRRLLCLIDILYRCDLSVKNTESGSLNAYTSNSVDVTVLHDLAKIKVEQLPPNPNELDNT